jgi:hypothetical protein
MDGPIGLADGKPGEVLAERSDVGRAMSGRGFRGQKGGDRGTQGDVRRGHSATVRMLHSVGEREKLGAGT